MSKRIQEQKMEGEPAVAKPRPVCLISIILNRGQYSSFGPDVCNIPENLQLDSGSVKGAEGNCWQNSVEGAARSCNIVLMIVLCTRVVAGNSNGAVPTAPCLTVPRAPRETATTD